MLAAKVTRSQSCGSTPSRSVTQDFAYGGDRPRSDFTRQRSIRCNSIVEKRQQPSPLPLTRSVGRDRHSLDDRCHVVGRLDQGFRVPHAAFDG